MIIHKAKVGYKLPDKEPVMWDFPSEENLKELGVRAENIETIRYSDYYPGDIYIELPIARDIHPAMGSFSANLKLEDGRKANVSDIWYQDFTIHHPVRAPHWNHQTRLTLSDWPEPKIRNDPKEHHQSPKSDYIEIIREHGSERKVNRLDWKEQEQVIKKRNRR